MYHPYEKEKLQTIVRESTTYREVLLKFGRTDHASAYRTLKKRLHEWNIDVSHFKNRSQIAKEMFEKKLLFKHKHVDIFVENSNVARSVVKKRILRENLLPYRCDMCRQDDKWKGKIITLILDHINGINNDHRLCNLRFLCPNCNATLETHCKGARGVVQETKKQINKEERRILRNLARRVPRPEMRKVERPTHDILQEEIAQLGYRGTGKKYGVSDNAVRKWLRAEE